jgi:AcrR family transcriptional regulator
MSEAHARVSERPSAARQRIYAAAVRLFAEKGATQLGVSELAAAAGVARGTIYNNLTDADSLFDALAEELVDEMSERLTRSLADIDDPAVRMGCALRHYVRRAHEEPDWGRFMTRFAYSNRSLQRLWLAGPGLNLQEGIETGRYRVTREQTRAVLGMIAGGVIGAMFAVLDGQLTWRSAGADTVELLLVALGIDRDEARRIAAVELPPLPPVQ